MAFASARAEPIEEVREFVWAKLLDAKSPKALEHALMF